MDCHNWNCVFVVFYAPRFQCYIYWHSVTFTPGGDYPIYEAACYGAPVPTQPPTLSISASAVPTTPPMDLFTTTSSSEIQAMASPTSSITVDLVTSSTSEGLVMAEPTPVPITCGKLVKLPPGGDLAPFASSSWQDCLTYCQQHECTYIAYDTVQPACFVYHSYHSENYFTGGHFAVYTRQCGYDIPPTIGSPPYNPSPSLVCICSLISLNSLIIIDLWRPIRYAS